MIAPKANWLQVNGQKMVFFPMSMSVWGDAVDIPQFETLTG